MTITLHIVNRFPYIRALPHTTAVRHLQLHPDFFTLVPGPGEAAQEAAEGGERGPPSGRRRRGGRQAEGRRRGKGEAQPEDG